MSISIKLEVFEGPLDLLLHLIDKNKVNIYDIPIIMITDQYLEYMRAMDSNKLEVMSQFIEMAAILLNIKAKTLLPEEVTEDEEELDPRQTLVDRLVEYKKFKLIAQEFKDYQLDANRLFYKAATIPEEVALYVPIIDPKEIVGDLDYQRLFQVFQSVMKKKMDKIDPIRSTYGEIRKESYSVEDKIEYILELGLRNKKMIFRQLLESQGNRTEVVVTFLAILELMKTGQIRIVQESLFDEILIKFIGCE